MDPHIPPGRGAAGVAGRGAREGRRSSRVRGADSRAHRATRRLDFLGRARVNVLELNLALDEALGAAPRPDRCTPADSGRPCQNGTQDFDLGSRHRPPGDRRLVPEARSADSDQEPGDVHRRGRQPADDDRLRPGAGGWRWQPLFTGQVAFWLWFTVLFANFAEAMAEGRGKAQADTLGRRRPKRSRTA